MIEYTKHPNVNIYTCPVDSCYRFSIVGFLEEEFPDGISLLKTCHSLEYAELCANRIQEWLESIRNNL